MYKLAAFTLFCATALPVVSQSKPLVVKSRVASNVTFDDSRTFALPTFCDAQGRSYIKLAKPGPGMVGSMFRLSAKGTVEAEFDTSGALVNVFAARPNGGVAMIRMDAGEKVVDNFGPDGKRESTIRLERPPIPFFPLQIAVFPSGEMLIAGLQYQPGYKASTAIYDPAGHVVKQFVLDGDAEIEQAIELGDARYTHERGAGNGPVSRSVAITGDDGFVYLMRATSPATVYVISSVGEVAHKIVVRAPTDTGLPNFGLRVVKNRLVVPFFRRCDSPVDLSCEGNVYTVVDAMTGRKLADYDAEKIDGGPLQCYAPDPDRFFTFSIPPGKHRLEIVEAGLH